MPNDWKGRPRRALAFIILAGALAVGVSTLTTLAGGGGGQIQLQTSIEDFIQPGTQPMTLTDPVLTSGSCAFCHADYLVADPGESPSYNEPFNGWTNSLMAQAARDPVWHAAVAIANQDAKDSGEYCIRCHSPLGWLAGRSMPADGSALDFDLGDFDGISCHFCHRLVDPVYRPGESPIEDFAVLVNLENGPAGTIGNARYIIDTVDRRRGPYQDIAENPEMNPHGVPVLYSPFHRKSEICGTCHDNSNPVYSRLPNGTYVLNALETEHPTQDVLDMFPEQRTYSEWAASDFANGGVFFPDGRFGGNHPTGIMSECQDCHMPDQVSGGCSFYVFEPWFERDDLPQHSFNGANSWVLKAVRELYDDGDTRLTEESVNDATLRTIDMMRAASDMQVTQLGSTLKVRVVNQSGHKLPTGYPEGRRMWLNVKFFGPKNGLIAERGAYDLATAELTEGDTKVYQAIFGISPEIAAAVNLPSGPSQRLTLIDQVLFDNRIPARGFTHEAYDEFGGAPTGHPYDDGQYWDDTEYVIPAGATSAVVTLNHQSMTKEYIEFLRDENTTNTAGQTVYDLWDDPSGTLGINRVPPLDMDSVVIDLTVPLLGDVDGDGFVDFTDLLMVLSAWGPCPPPNICPEDTNGDGEIDFTDLVIVLSNWT